MKFQWSGRGWVVVAAAALFWAWSGLALPAQQAGPPGERPAATQGPAGEKAPSALQAAAEPLEGVPVVLDGVEVFRVLVPAGPLTPEDRATAIARRLETVGSDPAFDEAALQIKDTPISADVCYRGIPITSVTAMDAEAAGVTRQALAESRLQVVRAALKDYRREHAPRSLARGILFALLAFVLVALAIRLTRLLSRWLGARVEGWLEREGWLGRRKLVGLMDRRMLVRASLVTLGAARWLLVAVFLYAGLTVAFGFFPWTRSLARLLAGYGLSPLKALGAGLLAKVPDLLFIGVVCVLAWLAVRALRWLFDRIAADEITVSWIDREWAYAYYRILRTVVFVGVAVIVFPYIPGSGTTAFRAITIFFGALATFGSSTAVSNLVNGLVLMTMRPYHTGDWIRVGDTEGEVVEVSLLVTRVRTPKNVVVTVPSSQMVGSHVQNFSETARTDGLVIHTTITIGYDAPWRKVHELLIQAALQTRGVLTEPAPFVLQTSLDDSYVSYQINAFTRDACGQPRLYGELHQNIQEAFNQAGVEIMSPAYHALRDGNTVTLPPAQRPEGYEPPSFRVRHGPGGKKGE